MEEVKPLRTHYLLCASLLLLSGCAALQHKVVQFDRLSDCPRYTADGLIAQQSSFDQLTKTHKLECALSFVRNTKSVPLRRSALGSHLCLHLAEREPDAKKREKLAAEGVRLAEAALALGDDKDGPLHYYLATNLGLAVRDHLTLAAENLPRLESELKRAVALSPDIDDGGPLRVLGLLYLKAPPWPSGIGDTDKSLELLKRAVDRFPGHPLNHLFYAQALWNNDGNSAASQAESEMETGLKLLQDGEWGYNKAPWEREFAAFQEEMDD